MRPLIHDFGEPGTSPCANWRDGDGLTAAVEAVTCPERRRRQAEADACPSRSARRGLRCLGQEGHEGLPHAEDAGVKYAWADENFAELSWELQRAT